MRKESRMYLEQTERWTVERIIRAMAGVLSFTGVVLSATASLWWLILPGLVGANLVVFSVTGFCPMAVALAKAGIPTR